VCVCVCNENEKIPTRYPVIKPSDRHRRRFSSTPCVFRVGRRVFPDSPAPTRPTPAQWSAHMHDSGRRIRPTFIYFFSSCASPRHPTRKLMNLDVSKSFPSRRRPVMMRVIKTVYSCRPPSMVDFQSHCVTLVCTFM